MSSSIPAISLQSLLEQKESDLLLLNDALHSHGFFSIVDHDIETDLLKESYKQAKIFFDLALCRPAGLIASITWSCDNLIMSSGVSASANSC
mgnify:CR=1 FL=1